MNEIPLERRKDDPIIMVINERLDKLEAIDEKIQYILEWIETLGRVTRAIEALGLFLTRWAVRFAKIGTGFATVWALSKYGLQGVWDFMRNAK